MSDLTKTTDFNTVHYYCIITAVFLERCRGQRSPQKLGFGLKIVVSAANNSRVVTFSVVASKDNQ